MPVLAHYLYCWPRIVYNKILLIWHGNVILGLQLGDLGTFYMRSRADAHRIKYILCQNKHIFWCSTEYNIHFCLGRKFFTLYDLFCLKHLNSVLYQSCLAFFISVLWMIMWSFLFLKSFGFCFLIIFIIHIYWVVL